MSDRIHFTEDVDNYTGGEPVTLEVGSRDGSVVVRLQKGQADPIAVLLTKTQANEALKALEGAIKEI